MHGRPFNLLKIGGSVITDRSRPCTYIGTNVVRIGQELRELGGTWIVVHGQGSYGRAFLPLYEPGLVIGRERASLAKRVQCDLRDLSRRVVDDLELAGPTVAGWDPDSIFAMKDGQISMSVVDLLLHRAEQGFVCVTYGGTVWDDSGGFRILSSDAIVDHIARRLHPSIVIWATDVDGVFSASADGHRQPIRSMTQQDLHSMLRMPSDSVDCTGGMYRKIQIAGRLAAEIGIVSFIVNGGRPNSIARAVNGDAECGTVVTG